MVWYPPQSATYSPDYTQLSPAWSQDLSTHKPSQLPKTRRHYIYSLVAISSAQKLFKHTSLHCMSYQAPTYSSVERLCTWANL